MALIRAQTQSMSSMDVCRLPKLCTLCTLPSCALGLFHGCPTCFPDRTKCIPGTRSTVQSAYEGTLDKRNMLANGNYTVVEMWECQLRQQLRQNPEMRAYFKAVPLTDPLGMVIQVK